MNDESPNFDVENWWKFAIELNILVLFEYVYLLISHVWLCYE